MEMDCKFRKISEPLLRGSLEISTIDRKKGPKMKSKKKTKHTHNSRKESKNAINQETRRNRIQEH